MELSLTNIIIGITAVVSLLALNNGELFRKLEYNPYLVYHRKQWYRYISHAFIHADLFHLFINMFVLYMFGGFTERFFVQVFGLQGYFYYVLLYLGGVLFASLPAIRKHRDNPSYNAVGASGAVSAVVFSAILINPVMKLYLFFALPIPAFVFGALYLYYEYYMDKKGGGRIAHDAHFWGAIYGAAATIAFEPKLGLNFFTTIFYHYFG